LSVNPLDASYHPPRRGKVCCHLVNKASKTRNVTHYSRSDFNMPVPSRLPQEAVAFVRRRLAFECLSTQCLGRRLRQCLHVLDEKVHLVVARRYLPETISLAAHTSWQPSARVPSKQFCQTIVIQHHHDRSAVPQLRQILLHLTHDV